MWLCLVIAKREKEVEERERKKKGVSGKQYDGGEGEVGYAIRWNGHVREELERGRETAIMRKLAARCRANPEEGFICSFLISISLYDFDRKNITNWDTNTKLRRRVLGILLSSPFHVALAQQTVGRVARPKESKVKLVSHVGLKSALFKPKIWWSMRTRQRIHFLATIPDRILLPEVVSRVCNKPA